MWAGCGTYRYSIQEPGPDEYRCYLEESYGAWLWDSYMAEAAIRDFCNGDSVRGTGSARDMTVPQHADWAANHMDPSWPQRYYFYHHPSKSYNISVFFADDIVPPREKVDNPLPSNKDCNSNGIKPFRVIDHKEDCLKMLDALDDCKSPITLQIDYCPFLIHCTRPRS